MVEERFSELEDGTEGFTRGIKKEMTECSKISMSVIYLLPLSCKFTLQFILFKNR